MSCIDLDLRRSDKESRRLHNHSHIHNCVVVVVVVLRVGPEWDEKNLMVESFDCNHRLAILLPFGSRGEH